MSERKKCLISGSIQFKINQCERWLSQDDAGSSRARGHCCLTGRAGSRSASSSQLDEPICTEQAQTPGPALPKTLHSCNPHALPGLRGTHSHRAELQQALPSTSHLPAALLIPLLSRVPSLQPRPCCALPALVLIPGLAAQEE